MKVEDTILRKSLDSAIEKSVLKMDKKKDKIRKFDESVDFIINLKDINLKDPKQRIDKELILPNEVITQNIPNICVVASDEILLEAKKMKLEAIKEIKKQNEEVKIVALTVHKRDEYILATLKAGADGYILKDASHSELVTAIKNVLSGKHYLSPEISGKVIDGYLAGNETLKIQSAWDTLTQREREILKLIAEGYKNKEVADYLFISLKTVEKHRSNLMKKLDLHNVAALTAYAMEKGLVSE